MRSQDLKTIYILEHKNGERESLGSIDGQIIFETIGSLINWHRKGELTIDNIEEYVYQVVAMEDIGDSITRIRRVILRNYP